MTVVAIDGPAGSGKSTVARTVAQRLGVVHVDTGASYRALTLAALRAGVDVDDEGALADLAARVDLSWHAGRTHLGGADVEDDIRTPEVDAHVSAVAAHPAVRSALVDVQRRVVERAGAVVEGRDAGTRVVPDADLKVWLTASVAARAARRADQRGERDVRAQSRTAAAIAARDERDAANMDVAPDAVEIDTTGLDVAAVVDRVVALARARAGRGST